MSMVSRVSLLAAGAAAASTAAMLMVGAGKNRAPFEIGAVGFAVVLVLLGTVPYLVTWRSASSANSYWRRWSAWAVALYGVGDLLTRVQVFFVPQSSTDGVALITYPFLGAGAAFSVAALLAAVIRRSGRRPPVLE